MGRLEYALLFIFGTIIVCLGSLLFNPYKCGLFGSAFSLSRARVMKQACNDRPLDVMVSTIGAPSALIAGDIWGLLCELD